MSSTIKIPNKLKNKGEVCSFLEDHMSKTYEKIKSEGEYEYGKNLLKTYIIESNHKNIMTFLQSLNGGASINWNKIDKTAYILDYKKAETEVNFYIDSTNARFWSFHTISSAKDTDWILNKLIQPLMSRLDNLWLDRNSLQNIKTQHADYTKSIGVQYRHGDVFPTTDFGDSFSLRANGIPSDILYDLFTTDPRLSNLFALSSVGFKKIYRPDESLKPNLLLEDVYYQGKFTVKGTSIYEHISTVSDIRDKYERDLAIIENEYNISYPESGGGFTIKGAPLCIDFKKEIEDMELFIQTIFTAREPFRISGFDTKLESGTYLLSCLDLHNGDDFRLEVTPNWIRIYLPHDACGNTIMRFLCNLQRYYDANASLEGLNSGKIR